MENGSDKPKRRRWQILCRIGVLIALLAALAYVTLPWWVPTGLVRAAIEHDIADKTGLSASVGDVSLSWAGVEISDLAIANPGGFSDTPMVSVGKIRAAFSPLNLLLRNRIAWATVISPRLLLEIRRDGQLNAAALNGLADGAFVEELGLRDGQVTLVAPDLPEPLVMNVRDMQLMAGRTCRLGRLTFVADVPQVDCPALITLRAQTGAKTMAGDVAFNFANLNMEKLPLPAMLGLPLKKLAGTCEGRLNLPVDADGRVKRAELAVTVANLDVQPQSGPPIPTIDRAGVQLTAEWDLAYGQLRIHSAEIDVPGARLTGAADLSADVLDGNWQAVRSLALQGVVYPGRLAAMLQPEGKLPGGMTIDNGVTVNISAKRDGDQFHLYLSGDATDAAIRREQRLIKPAGRKLTVAIGGQLDRRHWAFTAEGGELKLGDNSLTGAGALQNIHQVAEHWASSLRDRRFMDLFGDVAELKWQGSFELADIAALTDLGVAWQKLLGPVTLKGAVRGVWSLDPTRRPHLIAECSAPAGTLLTVGDAFAKVPDEPLQTLLTADLDPAAATVKNIALTFTDKIGHVKFHDGIVTLEEPQPGSLAMAVNGRFSVEKIDTLLRCLPRLALRNFGITGGLTGDFSAKVNDDGSAAVLRADLTDLTVRTDGIFRKSDGQAMQFGLQAMASEGKQRLAMQVQNDAARVSLNLLHPAGTASGGPTAVAGEIDVRDAGAMIRQFPRLQKALTGWSVHGPLTMKLTGLVGIDGLEVNVQCDANELAFSGGPAGRSKSADVPLSITAALGVQRNARGVYGLRLSDGELTFSDSVAQFAAGAIFEPSRTAGQSAKLTRLGAGVQLTAAVDKPLLALLPELAKLAKQYGLGGAFSAGARLNVRDKTYHLTGNLDIDDLIVAWGDTVHKTADQPAWAAVELSGPTDFSRLQLNGLEVRVGKSRLLADAMLKKAAVGTRSGRWDLTAAHVSAQTWDATTLAAYSPALAAYKPAGKGFAELAWTDDNGGRLDYLTLANLDLTGRWRDKSVAVRGNALLRDVRLSEVARRWLALPHEQRAGSKPAWNEWASVGTVRTDPLEFRAGENHLWLIADLKNLPVHPSGTMQLLATYINDKDLSEWLAPGSTQPPSGDKLDKDAVASLQKKADALLKMLTPTLLSADLSLRASVDDYDTYDVMIGQMFHIRELELDASLSRGLGELAYRGGLNGGIVPTRYHVDFAARSPMVYKKAQVRDVRAAANIQPLLNQFFPGNSVHGYFSRDEDVQYPLRDALAAMADPRYRVFPTGTAVTVTTNGVLVGRAAPKFVASIFPGLNLARFEYDRMTGFAKFLPDGTAENDMIFNGSPIDTYIEGKTGPDNVGEYEIGTILLSSPQSPEFNHAYHSGRIPILKFRGRIEDGKIHDEEVSYLWPPETLYVIFLKNNPVYRIWLQSQKP